MLAYTFIIPFLSKLLDMSGGATSSDITVLSKIILGYLAVKISSTTLTELITKIIERFRS
jgi:predicted histidine transporter YuiF (NhaC family)